MTARRWEISTPSWTHQVTTDPARSRKVAVDELDEIVTAAPSELKKFVGKPFRKLIAWAETTFDDQVEREEILTCSSEACEQDREEDCEGCGAALCREHATHGQYEARTLCGECVWEAIQQEFEGQGDET